MNKIVVAAWRHIAGPHLLNQPRLNQITSRYIETTLDRHHSTSPHLLNKIVVAAWRHIAGPHLLNQPRLNQITSRCVSAEWNADGFGPQTERDYLSLATIHIAKYWAPPP